MWVVGGGPLVAALSLSQDCLSKVSSKSRTFLGNNNLWGVLLKGDFLNVEVGYLGGKGLAQSSCYGVAGGVARIYNNPFIFEIRRSESLKRLMPIWEGHPRQLDFLKEACCLCERCLPPFAVSARPYMPSDVGGARRCQLYFPCTLASVREGSIRLRIGSSCKAKMTFARRVQASRRR